MLRHAMGNVPHGSMQIHTGSDWLRMHDLGTDLDTSLFADHSVKLSSFMGLDSRLLYQWGKSDHNRIHLHGCIVFGSVRHVSGSK